MSRSFRGEEKETAKRNHHNRKVEDTFQWEQVKAGFMAEPKLAKIKISKAA